MPTNARPDERPRAFACPTASLSPANGAHRTRPVMAQGNPWARSARSALTRDDRKHDVRRMRRVMHEPLVRDHERAVALVVSAGVEIPIVLRKQCRRHTHAESVAWLEHARREPEVDVVLLDAAWR